MKLNKTLIMSALVATGLFAGIPLQAQDAPKDKPAGETPAAPRTPGMGGRPAFSVDGLAKQLDLTEDQKTKAKPILEDLQKKNAELQKDTSVSQEDRRAKRKEIRDAAGVKLKEILTPEQYAKWEKLGNRQRPGAPAAAPAGDEKPKN